MLCRYTIREQTPPAGYLHNNKTYPVAVYPNGRESLFKRSVASREICELRNMVNVGYLIMRQAMERKESRGLHYTIDYPHVKK